MNERFRNRRRRVRTVATLVAIGGLIATAAGVQATAASWADTVEFAAQVSAATTTTTTTTTSTTTTTLPPTSTTTTTTPPTTSTTTTLTTTTASTTTTTTLPPTTTTTAPPPPPAPTVDLGGIGGANPNTVVRDIDWGIDNPRQVCTVAKIAGIDATPRHWAIRINLNAPPWNGTPASQISLNGTGTLVVESPTSVLITGRTHGGGWDPRTNNTPITASQTALVTICSYSNLIPPPADPSWYTVTQVQGTQAQGTWTDTKACVVVTATTNRNNLSTYPYYFGWQTQIDLTAAKARITGAGKTLNYVDWGPYPSGQSHFWTDPPNFNPPLDSYTLTSGFEFALRAAGGGSDSKSTTVCVMGW